MNMFNKNSKRFLINSVILFGLAFSNILFANSNELKDGEKKEPLKTELKDYNGAPTLFINGKPHHRIFSSVPSSNMQNMIDAEFDIFDTHPFTPHGWIGDGEYDYSETDKFIEKYIKQKSDALLILRVWMGFKQEYSPKGSISHEPSWYVLEHPEAAIKTTQEGVQGQNMHTKIAPSFAAEQYRLNAGEAIKRFVAHVEEKYGNNVLGYVVGGGPYGEWLHWHSYNWEDPDPELLDDYSEVMRQAFIRGVKDKYTTIQELNKSWKSNYTSFKEIQIPGIDKRLSATVGNLRDINHEQMVIDFYEIYNRETVDDLTYWSAKAKEGCNRNKVIMAFYGYLWLHQNSFAGTLSGHVDMDMVLECPDIDYIVSPYMYSFRQLGGVFSGQSMVSSTLMRGKQYIHEADNSTFIKPSWSNPEHNAPTNLEETMGLLKRDLGKTLTEGSSIWIMDLHKGMYDDPDLVAALKKSVITSKEHSATAGENNKQVAVVLKPDDFFYYKEREKLLAPLIYMFKQFELEAMGLSYDDLIIEDLERLSPEQTEKYKLWIFPSAIALTDEEIALLEKHVFRNNNYVLWNYAAGVSSEKGFSLERMEDLTGFKCGYTMTPGEAIVQISETDHILTKGLNVPVTYGTNGDVSRDTIKYHACLNVYPSSDEPFNVTPRFFIKESDENLGDFISYKNGEYSGLGIKNMNDWNSVLSTAPMLVKGVLRNMAEAAGCHVYTNFPGQTFHCKNYVGIYFHESGKCKIKLPRISSEVKEVWSGKIVAKDTDIIEIDAKINETVLFKY